MRIREEERAILQEKAGLIEIQGDGLQLDGYIYGQDLFDVAFVLLVLAKRRQDGTITRLLDDSDKLSRLQFPDNTGL